MMIIKNNSALRGDAERFEIIFEQLLCEFKRNNDSDME